jgi:hypothetical protein
MSANLEVMRKIANTSNSFPIRELRKSTSAFMELKTIKYEPTNYCDDDLDIIFFPREQRDDNWWGV